MASVTRRMLFQSKHFCKMNIREKKKYMLTKYTDFSLCIKHDCISRQIYVPANLIKALFFSFEKAASNIKKSIFIFLVHSCTFKKT